jgi:micrococcal nuclease
MIKDSYIRKGIVTNIVDGDTIDITLDLGYQVATKQRIRLLGVDTPERGEEGYLEAKAFVSESLLGEEVMIESFKSDSFGRYLAYVYPHKSIISINDALIQSGLARVYGK